MTRISLIVDVDIPDDDRIHPAEYVADALEGRWVDLHCYVPSPEELEDREIARKRYTARFVPQVWVRDQAIECDAYGDTEWDCTDAFVNIPDHEYVACMVAEMAEARDGEVLDSWDWLQAHGENIPQWVRDWQGPFSLYVRETT